MLMNLKKFNYKLKNKKWSVSQHNQFVSIDQYFTTHIRKWNFKLCRSLLYLWFSFSIHRKVWAKFQHVTIYLSMHGIGIRSVEDLKTTASHVLLSKLLTNEDLIIFSVVNIILHSVLVKEWTAKLLLAHIYLQFRQKITWFILKRIA
jgi:hypothetical protein